MSKQNIKIGDTELTPEIVKLTAKMVETNSTTGLNELKGAVAVAACTMLTMPSYMQTDETRAQFGTKLAQLYEFIDEFEQLLKAD